MRCSVTDAVLVRSRRESVELFAGLGANVEDRKRWIRLRNSVPELQNVPLSQLRSKLAEATSWRVGEFDCAEAERREKELMAAGLVCESKQKTSISHTAFDLKLQMPVLMIDGPSTGAMVEQMLKQGVCVVDE